MPRSPDLTRSPEPVPCTTAPYVWTDPQGRDEKNLAVKMCFRCPMLLPCRKYASHFKWFDIVIAGWVAPRAGTSSVPGSYPPWSPLAKKPEEAAS